MLFGLVTTLSTRKNEPKPSGVPTCPDHLDAVAKAVPANFSNAGKPVSIDPAPKQEAESVAGD